MARRFLRHPRLFATAFAAFSLALSAPANALWLQSTDAPRLDSKPFVVSLDGLMKPPTAPSFLARLDLLAPPPRYEHHGLFAMPPARDATGLRAQYRSDFPLSVTFETDGAVIVDRQPPTGAMNFLTRIVFSRDWWSPQLTSSFADFRVDQLPQGRIQYGEAKLRSEWKVRF